MPTRLIPDIVSGGAGSLTIPRRRRGGSASVNSREDVRRGITGLRRVKRRPPATIHDFRFPTAHFLFPISYFLFLAPQGPALFHQLPYLPSADHATCMYTKVQSHALNVHGFQSVTTRERRIAASCVAIGIACVRAVATISRSAGSP